MLPLEPQAFASCGRQPPASHARSDIAHSLVSRAIIRAKIPPALARFRIIHSQSVTGQTRLAGRSALQVSR